MSKKIEAIKKAVFYAQQDPEALATLLSDVISDVATTVEISGASSIAIPESDSVTEEYLTAVLSQFGDEMGDQTITLAIKTAVTGVSISSGVVTVASTTTADSFVLKATSGTLTKEMTVTLV